MGNVDKEKKIVAEKGKAMHHTLQMIMRFEHFLNFTVTDLCLSHLLAFIYMLQLSISVNENQTF